jgi:hypothetical protein
MEFGIFGNPVLPMDSGEICGLLQVEFRQVSLVLAMVRPE